MNAMRQLAFALLLAALLLAPACLTAQPSTVTGKWAATADFWGTPINFSMELHQEGEKLTGDFGGDKVEGTLKGSAIHFIAKDEQGGTEELTATLQGLTISGTMIFTDSDDK